MIKLNNMFGVIKLSNDHAKIVKELSDKLGISESAVVEVLMEDIQMVLISFRNGKDIEEQVISVLKNRDLSWKMSGILNENITLNT